MFGFVSPRNLCAAPSDAVTELCFCIAMVQGDEQQLLGFGAIHTSVCVQGSDNSQENYQVGFLTSVNTDSS